MPVQLKTKLNEIVEEQKEMLNKVKAENRSNLNADEEKIYSKLENERDLLVNMIKEQPVNKLPRSNPDNPINSIRTVSTAGARDYKNMFFKNNAAQMNKNGFKDFHEFISVLSANKFDPRLESIRAALVTNVPSDGGFLVPTEFAPEILDIALESEIIRPRARIWPMMSETLQIPGFDGFDHSSGSVIGGFSGQWLAEGGAATREQPKYRSIELKADKLAIFSQASRELVQSGLTFEQQLFTAMIQATSWHMDNAFITGNGVGRPLGILNDPALITIDKETGQAAETVVYENLTKMFSRIHPSSLNNSIWICNSSLIPQLLALSIPVGTAGSHVPVLSQSGDGSFTMLTRPVVFTEKAKAVGTVGDIILADLSQYAIGMRQEIIMDRSNAPGWLNDLEDFRTIVRVAGQGTWSKVFTPLNGPTQSWVVTLAERA